MEINDRRPPRPLPKPEDYETPLSRTTVKSVHQEYRQTGVRGRLGADKARADQIVRQATKDRFTARRQGIGDFETLAEYKEFLLQAGEN